MTMEGITLPPEAKIHMALDDIIRIEKPYAAISHNMYRRRRPQYRKGPQRPFWRRRRFISQNWRLKGNGPRAPKNRMKILNFLERKYATKPLGSVFHRLGNRNLWNNQWDMSRKKLRNAKRSFFNRVPQYHQKIELDQSMQPADCEPAKPLTKVDFAKLREVMGGLITSVSQKSTDDGHLITTITGLDNTSNFRSDLKFNPSDGNINSQSNMRMNSNFQQLSDSDIINNLNNGRGPLLGGVNNTMNSIAQNQFGMVSRQAAENRIFQHNMNRAFANASGSVMNSQTGPNIDFSGLNGGTSSLLAYNMQNSGMDQDRPFANNTNYRTMNASSAAANLPVWMNSNGRMNGANLANFNMNKNISRADYNSQDSLPPLSSTNFSIIPHSAGLIQNRFTNGPDISFD